MHITKEPYRSDANVGLLIKYLKRKYTIHSHKYGYAATQSTFFEYMLTLEVEGLEDHKEFIKYVKRISPIYFNVIVKYVKIFDCKFEPGRRKQTQKWMGQ